MTDEELVEKVARGLCSRVLSDIEIADSAEAVIDNSWRAYVADAETALAIARPIIEREAFDEAAKVADDEDQKIAYSGQHNIWMARQDALEECAAAIRALMEQSK